jgi:hypothetical protein
MMIKSRTTEPEICCICFIVTSLSLSLSLRATTKSEILCTLEPLLNFPFLSAQNRHTAAGNRDIIFEMLLRKHVPQTESTLMILHAVWGILMAEFHRVIYFWLS